MTKQFEYEDFSSKEKVPWPVMIFGWMIEQVLRILPKSIRRNLLP